MNEKRAMTLSLSEKEMVSLESLAMEKAMSKTAVIKQALRLYQSLSARITLGEKIFFEDPATKEKAELMVL